MFTKQLTPEDGKKALLHHVVEKALALRKQYGGFIDYETLLKILQDNNFVRYPTRLEFNSGPIDKGFFAVVDALDIDNPSKGYTIYIHEYFKKRLGDVPAIVLYQLVAINYGVIATSEEAEIFGATVLDMKKEEYYQLLCVLADQIPK
jgi:hypothetical protein